LSLVSGCGGEQSSGHKRSLGRPLFCAAGKNGLVSGTALSDKAVVRLIKQADGDAGLNSDETAESCAAGSERDRV
jgi:hypothetical protein